MPTVRIGSIIEGLVISSDVKDLNGRMLLRKGVTLQDRHIQLLKSWGVTEVEVLTLPQEEVANLNASPEDKLKSSTKLEAEASLKKIFSRNDLKHVMIHELFELCVIRKAKLPW